MTAAGAPPDDFRLRARRNPLHLAVSGSLWRSVWFLMVYVFATGWLLFAAALAASVTAAAFAVTIAGLPLLTAAAGVVRGCANVERARLSAMFTRPVRGQYRPVTEKGVVAQATTRWKDRATWRELAYLIGLWPALLILDTVVFTVWLVFLAGITVPIWYWAPESTFSHGVTAHGVPFGDYPSGPHGAGAHGFYVDTLPKALLAAAACLILFLLFNYVVVATARAHARVARALLRPPADPLAAVKDVLAHPGPLQSLTP
ncbi:MAG: sensor domain-containing protein [Actinomycetota bacterium]|nr:sensor domain-containing protein [Actinomycetota bacterium]